MVREKKEKKHSTSSMNINEYSGSLDVYIGTDSYT